ncbi:MAG: ABC transporter permease [Pseudomonadota bacterium]
MAENELKVTVYTTGSAINHPVDLFKGMISDLLASKELAYRLMIRDISSLYRQTFLGIFWAFIPPIVTGAVFILLNKNKIINVGQTDIPYPIYALVGTILWQVFVDALNAPLKIINSSKEMLSKVNFPKEALILSGLGQTIFNFVLRFLIILVVFVIFDMSFTFGIFYSIFAVLILIFLGLSIGWLLVPIGVLYADVSKGLTFLSMIWFFFTPVIYPPMQGFPLSLINVLNPVSSILIGARDLATKGVLNNPISFFITTLIIFALLIIAWVIYKITMPILIEKINA